MMRCRPPCLTFRQRWTARQLKMPIPTITTQRGTSGSKSNKMSPGFFTHKPKLAEQPFRSKALATEKERFRSRRSEVRRQLNERSIARLTREVEDLRLQARQLHFDADRNAAIRSELHDLEEELERRTKHNSDLLRYLEHEEKRVLEAVLPRQFTLRGEVQVFPVAVEIRFPGGSQSESRQ